MSRRENKVVQGEPNPLSKTVKDVLKNSGINCILDLLTTIKEIYIRQYGEPAPHAYEYAKLELICEEINKRCVDKGVKFWLTSLSSAFKNCSQTGHQMFNLDSIISHTNQ